MLAVTLDQSPVVITGWPLLFIHTTAGLRQMGLMSSRALHLFWTLIYLERRHCFWENVSFRLSKNKTHLNLKKKKLVTQINSKWESIHLEFSSEKRQKIMMWDDTVTIDWLIDTVQLYWVWWLFVRNYRKDHRGDRWLTVFKVQPLHPKAPWKGRESPHHKL